MTQGKFRQPKDCTPIRSEREIASHDVFGGELSDEALDRPGNLTAILSTLSWNQIQPK